MKIDWKNIGWLMIIFLALELVSFGAVYNVPAFIILAAIAAGLTLYRTEYGLLMVLGELFIGSMGHMFYLDIASGRVPLRIGLFAAFFSVFALKFIYQLIRDRRQSAYLKNIADFSGNRHYLLLAAFILVSLVNAWWRNNGLSLVFNDFNAWAYFLLVIPAVAIYGGGEEKRFARLETLFLAGALWMSLKTLFFLFLFAHNAVSAPAIYYWLRRTLGGEVTVAAAGWPRVFIQGQVYAGIAFFLVFWLRPAVVKLKDLFRWESLSSSIFGAIFLSAIIVSLSRSFWVGFIITVAAGLFALWRLRKFRSAWLGAVWIGIATIFSLCLIYGAIIIPYRQGPSVGVGESLFGRVTGDNEPAVASRWALLPVLWDKISQEPVLGQGYGATVTYISKDPRVLALSPSGEYTTYAFEWGYLDIWLKLGILGLAAYLVLLGRLIWRGWKQGQKGGNALSIGLASALIFLAATNIFTPYLNHPLGIGFLILSSCLIWTNKVY